MPYSSNTYPIVSSVGPFTIPFEYISKTDVRVSLDGTALVYLTDFTFDSQYVLRLTVARTGTVKIYRVTERATRLVDFQDASVLTEDDLDTANKQALFVALESVDAALDAQALAASLADSVSSAASALTAANNAIATANAIAGVAATANTNAASAVVTANAIAGNASTALSVANAASVTAGTANTNASAAVTTANGIAATASSAQTAANAAVTTANAAATPSSVTAAVAASTAALLAKSAFINYSLTGGTLTVLASRGIASVSRFSIGKVIITLASLNPNLCAISVAGRYDTGAGDNNTPSGGFSRTAFSSTTFTAQTTAGGSGTGYDCDYVSVAIQDLR